MRKYFIEDLENEIWIENNGYEVSNKGRIIGKKGKLLKGNPAKDGYVPCSIKFEDGFYAGSFHRAVAYLFVPNPDIINKIEVNHKDGIKHHNYDTNLEWVTKKENQQHESDVLKQRNCEKHWGTILKEEQVIEIYNLCKEGKMKYKDIAELYNIEACQVSLIVSGDKWKYLNLEPLPRLIRGARGRSKQIIWINENKEYISMTKCSEDLKDTYGIIISSKMIKRICEGEFSEKKGQQFKYIQTQ